MICDWRLSGIGVLRIYLGGALLAGSLESIFVALSHPQKQNFICPSELKEIPKTVLDIRFSFWL
jgi:hypothetical protein